MPYISKFFIDKIKDEADLVSIINDYLEQPLKKAGSVLKASSPWSADKTASFTVSPSKGIWKDFSSGKGGNNAISFVMEKTGCSFHEAIEAIAKKMSLEVQYDDTKEAKKHFELQAKKEGLRPLLQATINQYHKQFLALPEDHPAKLEVFGKRQYTQQIVEEYQIGYAGDDKLIYNLCVAHAKKEDGETLGLINEYGDRFRNRVIYPIIQKKANQTFPVGMAGRDLTNDKKSVKWINSSDSILYKKDNVWFGLDHALESIVKLNECWLMEGYNDVIAWQTHGIPNTVAGCGTSIGKPQITLLKKYCDKVIFCMDPDAAGIRSMLKYIPEFLEAGFRVETVMLPKVDPDDFVRVFKTQIIEFYEKELLNSKHETEKLEWQRLIDTFDVSNFIANNYPPEDGFKVLLKENITSKKGVDKSKNTKELCRTLANIKDDAIQIIYAEWLAKESGTKITQIKTWIKDFIKENEVPQVSEGAELTINSDGYYQLPATIKEPINNLRPTIERYQMFMGNNQIWMQTGTEPPFRFTSVSNFRIEIIQHMQDEKFPMKLVRIKNIHGLERIFDMQSADMNSPMAFENAVTAHGNFRWKGGRREHETLKTFLFDGMGTGRKIDVLGWQPEGFWVWNNKIKVPKKDNIAVDENGVFEKDDVMYYVPSANQIYRNNLYKYEAQKKLVSIYPENLTFQNYANQVLKVHRHHGMMGILFSIASMFQDIVVSQINSFPMLFLFGPASSGKDLLADCCQSFFGHPQTAINLEGGVSTIKAQVREFAQFSNTISQLSEYKNGDPKLDGVLKGLWDRRGYKRGNIDSHVGTESIPILSSVIMTGNYAPDQEALITRLIWNFMDKTSFSEDEIKDYEKLADMNKKGISGFTDVFIEHRESVKNNFKVKFREFKATLSQRHEEANSRMVTNLSVLGTFYQMFQNVPQVHFPFSHEEMMAHFDKTIELQMNKMSTASIINRWWDCFLASMRGTLADQIKVGRDLKLEGDSLYFNFTSCYNRVSRQWYVQYRDSAPAKGVMMDSLKKDKAWIDAHSGVRFAPGRESKATSAYQVNLQQIPISDEIKFAVDFQTHENSLFPSSPATPNNNTDTEDGDDLLF